MSLKPLIGRVGGKSKIKTRIRKMIPPHTTYIEPFVGGGSVFFSVPANPNVKDVINDKDKEIAQIYLDVKNLGDKIELGPAPTREQFVNYKNKKKYNSPLERAKRNLILSRYSFRSNRKDYAADEYKKNRQEPKGKYGRYAERLKNTRILNQDYKSVINKYDNPNAFIYLDPPYSRAAEEKDYEKNDVPIEELINFLKGVKGKFILSYENSNKVKQLSRDAGFRVLNVSTNYTAGGVGKGTGGHKLKTNELLIRNY